MSAAPDNLRIRVETSDGVSVLSLEGEIAFSNAPALLEQAARVAGAGARHLIVDLSQVSYLDSSGVGTLVQIKRMVEQAGGGLALAALQPRVLGVFQITNLTQFFRIAPTVDEARGG
ncbi:MAG: STAS domain-containing protein [Planctomycetia bacterium]|nr:MAG: STAS domain-containing protein [Planctomycetia bacterium]